MQSMTHKADTANALIWTNERSSVSEAFLMDRIQEKEDRVVGDEVERGGKSLRMTVKGRRKKRRTITNTKQE